MPADSAPARRDQVRRGPRARRAPVRALAVIAAVGLLAACGGSGKPSPAASGQPAATVTTTASPAPSATTIFTGPVPGIVAVTRAGALVELDPAVGVVTKTLVARGVVGNEISAGANGIVYFAVRQGCADQIEAVTSNGGSPVVITPGSLPALSPDGTRLAFTSQPLLAPGCVVSNSDLISQYKLEVRTLTSGAELSYPMLPPGRGSGLPAPISHLSWSADNTHLAVSISAPQDNEGWDLTLVDTQAARYYLTGPGVSDVRVTGQPSRRQSYLREGVYLPDGDLFVSRACCAGFPEHNTSRLMWEVTTRGRLVRQVAVGFPNLEHTSLDATSDGKWLLYLAGGDLYVSQGGQTPRKVRSDLIAAAWQ